MTNFNFTSQSTETRNSAVANIFSNVTVKQVAEKFIKKLRKAESFDEGKRNVCTEIQIKSSDTFRVTIDGGFNENNGKYWCNIHIEEKMGNRFVHFSESNNLRGNEGVWCKALSALYCGIIDEIAVMIDYELSRWEKEINREKINGTNFGWAIHKWETITGCEYVEVEDCAENNEGVTSLDMDSSVAVVEQEISNAPSLDDDEYDTLGTGAIEMFNAYMRERVSEEFESRVDALKDSADEFSGEEVYCEFIYEFDYEQEWLDYITNMDDINVTSEYALDFYKEYIGWFINADDMLEYIYSIEEGCGAWTENHGCECCDIYVENPYYVSDEMRANRIAKVVNDNWVKNAVEESVKLDWSLFNEQDMELMFSDNDFAKMVYDRVCDSNKYFSECLAYDDCFYVWLTENVSCILVDYIYDLDSRPAWVDRHVFDFKDCGEHLEIIMFGSHKIGLYYDPSDSNADFACADNGGAYGKADMEYAVEIMDNRDMILALAEKARIVKPSVEEIIENALESAMDSGEEYYADNICEIGDWYVNYTSPCKEFPEGCVCVVDSEGRMYGNWCNVSDSSFAVEYLVNTIEMCNKEFNNVA